MSDLASDSRAALAEGGVLARNIPGFVARPAQQRLTEAIAHAFATRGELRAEAGTGTGKTFAYLVPALLSGMKTIISTGTKALQDQLYHRDLPRVRDALGVGLTTALLKGRANYLCRYRLEQAKGEPRMSGGILPEARMSLAGAQEVAYRPVMSVNREWAQTVVLKSTTETPGV